MARKTNRQLISELRGYANYERFGSYFRDAPVTIGRQQESGDFIREETKLYRETWIMPLIEEIERRLCK